MAGKWWNRLLMYENHGEPLPVHKSGRGFFLLYFVIFLVVGSMSGADLWNNSVFGSWALTRGNTEQSEYSGSIAFKREGDLKIGAISLKDTELRITLSHSRGILSDSLYQHEGEASVLFDVMAHQDFSPFLITSWEYDSTAGLESRTEAGVGLKWTLGHGFSISGVALFEIEDYVGENITTQIRWSFRPKFKKSFPSGISVNYVVFFKPIHGNFDNYLIKHNAAIELPTALKWLAIKLTVKDDYNSQPPAGVMKWDNEVNVGVTVNF